ncbi:MAG TPA: ABC transporter permease [Dehalococcoidia bacterium]|nr:ABC transporter permease [Dehalococcoidia bacterium]
MALTVDVERAAEPLLPTSNWRRSVLAGVRKKPVGALAGLACGVLIFLAIFGPDVAPYSPNRVDFPYLQSPSLSHPLGTDNLFRDQFSRIIYGARNSLGIGFSAILVSIILGVALGITSGYLGGVTDSLVNGFINVLFSYPSLVLVIFLVTVFGREFVVISIAIGLILAPYTIRVVRSATLAIRGLPYVEAARSVGCSPVRIMYRHILPNVMPYVIVVASVNIGLAILIEAALSFLGLGVSSDLNPSWGRMLQESRNVWQQAWWTAVAPGLAISFAVVAFNVFGDALRDWLDPRLRGGG